MVSIQHVNSETGIIQDLPAMAAIIKRANPKTVFHSDGVQAFTKLPIDLKKTGIDLYSISAHKFHGIKGAGALILSRQLNLVPILQGGNQENGLRSGTENVAAIAAMGQAAKIACQSVEGSNKKVADFSEWFKNQLKENIPEIDIFEPENKVPHIINFSLPGIPGEVLLHHLANKQIYISTGSACNANSKKMSGAYKELGFTPQKILETVRLSLSHREIPEDKEELLGTFLEVVRELQAMNR